MNEQDHVHIPANFKLVAKIGLSVAATALLGLLLALFVLSDDKASGYGEIIGAFSLAKKNLAPVMIVFGLAMVCFAGVSTWLFALYASFRIAGPIFRISRNLEQQIRQGPIAPMPIRATDSLQREWKCFEASVFALRAHYEEFRRALSAVDASTAGNSRADNANTLDLAMTQLTKVEHRVHL